jgi:hypothetical protein
MSKMDNLRAMREARYEQAAARSPKAAAQQTSTPTTTPTTTTTTTTTSTTKTATRVATPPAAAPAPTAPTTTAAAEPEAALCGHRAISGRTCTREAGHAAKSHRYA